MVQILDQGYAAEERTFHFSFLVNYINCNFCRNILFSVSVNLLPLFTVEETHISGFGKMRRKTSDSNI
jgi:hypothetical protein